MLLKKFDKDGNGKLDIEEFADFYAEAKATYVSVWFISLREQGYVCISSVHLMQGPSASSPHSMWKPRLCAHVAKLGEFTKMF